MLAARIANQRMSCPFSRLPRRSGALPFNPSEVGIVWSAAALRRNPVYILAWVFDVASFAVHAVLSVDLEPRVGPCLVIKDFIHPRWAISCRRLGVFGEVDADRDGGIPQD